VERKQTEGEFGQRRKAGMGYIGEKSPPQNQRLRQSQNPTGIEKRNGNPNPQKEKKKTGFGGGRPPIPERN